jgi:hypothetical protein
VLEYFFFLEFNIRLYDKISESHYFFFLHHNQNIFFSNIGNQNIFLEKTITPPFQVKWSFPKIMEHILHSNVISHLQANIILSENQHGFRKHRSCESQLAITLQELADGLNSGDQMDCILLDFSKAFDEVPHQRIWNKCSYYGIRGNTLLWIASFLQGRTKQVVLDGKKSETSDLTSEVANEL